jgi:hypothetical protein
MYRQAWIVSAGTREAKSTSPSREIVLAMAQNDEAGSIQYDMAIAQQQALERGNQ